MYTYEYTYTYHHRKLEYNSLSIYIYVYTYKEVNANISIMTYAHVYVEPICPSMLYLCIYSFVCLSIYLPTHLSIHLFIYLGCNRTQRHMPTTLYLSREFRFAFLLAAAGPPKCDLADPWLPSLLASSELDTEHPATRGKCSAPTN